MDQKQIAKQMMDFNKTAFDNTFNAMTFLRDQTEKFTFRFLEKAPWFPEEGKNVITEWIKAYKKACEEFKAAADESYKKITDYVAKTEKEEVQKAGKK